MTQQETIERDYWVMVTPVFGTPNTYTVEFSPIFWQGAPAAANPKATVHLENGNLQVSWTLVPLAPEPSREAFEDVAKAKVMEAMVER
jgi:hypothetical protein